MKRIEKEIKKIVYQYESIDGQRFDTEEDCKKWESSYLGTLEASMKNIRQISVCAPDLGIPYACEDWYVFVVRPSGMNEIVLLNAYIQAKTNNPGTLLTNDHVGKYIALNFGYDYDYCEIYVLDTWAEVIQKNIDDVIAEYEKEN